MTIDKAFISNIDKKLAEFDANHPKSPAQQAEIDKYQKVYKLRDNPTDSYATKDRDIWDFEDETD